MSQRWIVHYFCVRKWSSKLFSHIHICTSLSLSLFKNHFKTSLIYWITIFSFFSYFFLCSCWLLFGRSLNQINSKLVCVYIIILTISINRCTNAHRKWTKKKQIENKYQNDKKHVNPNTNLHHFCPQNKNKQTNRNRFFATHSLCVLIQFQKLKKKNQNKTLQNTNWLINIGGCQ